MRTRVNFNPILLKSHPRFKSNRASLPYVWAETAPPESAAVDPDLDTGHFLFIEGRYENLGWQATEIEPEQWQNFLQQITDLKIKELMEYGIFQWFADVTYRMDAICSFNNSIFISSVADNLGNAPDVPGFWEEIYTLSAATYEQTLGELMEIGYGHIDSLGAANPHEDDVTTIGGYTQAEIDWMHSPDNPESMAHHVADLNNPHVVTTDQLGILPVEGGTFTGTVTFSGGLVGEIDDGAVAAHALVPWFVGWTTGTTTGTKDNGKTNIR